METFESGRLASSLDASPGEGLADRPTESVAEADDGSGGWGFVYVDGSEDQLPQGWRERARQVSVVPLLAEEARSLLSGDPSAPELVGQELEIARMAARGATIREITRALRISQRSTERGLARLRDRFGIKSKQELGAFLAARGFDR